MKKFKVYLENGEFKPLNDIDYGMFNPKTLLPRKKGKLSRYLMNSGGKPESKLQTPDYAGMQMAGINITDEWGKDIDGYFVKMTAPDHIGSRHIETYDGVKKAQDMGLDDITSSFNVSIKPKRRELHPEEKSRYERMVKELNGTFFGFGRNGNGNYLVMSADASIFPHKIEKYPGVISAEQIARIKSPEMLDLSE